MTKLGKVQNAGLVIFTIAGEALLLVNFAGWIPLAAYMPNIPEWLGVSLVFGCGLTAPLCFVPCPAFLKRFGALERGKATGAFRLLNVVGTVAGVITPWIWGILYDVMVKRN